MSQAVSALFQALFGWIQIFQFWAVLAPYERGVLVRLGKHKRTLGPGLHWRWPLGIDQILTDHITTATHQFELIADTADDKTVTVHFAVEWSICDIELMLLFLENREMTAFARIQECAAAVVSETPRERLHSCGWRVKRRCARAAAEAGVGVESVRVTQVVRTRAYRLISD